MKSRIIETECGFYAQVKPFIKWKTIEKFKYPFPDMKNLVNKFYLRDKMPDNGEIDYNSALETLNEYAKNYRKSTFSKVRLEKEI